MVVTIPSGVTNIDFSMLSQTNDIDVEFNRVNAPRDSGGQCLVGYACTVRTAGTQTVEGMTIFFSGDDTSPPVTEQGVCLLAHVRACALACLRERVCPRTRLCVNACMELLHACMNVRSALYA